MGGFLPTGERKTTMHARHPTGRPALLTLPLPLCPGPPCGSVTAALSRQEQDPEEHQGRGKGQQVLAHSLACKSEQVNERACRVCFCDQKTIQVNKHGDEWIL